MNSDKEKKEKLIRNIELVFGVSHAKAKAVFKEIDLALKTKKKK